MSIGPWLRRPTHDGVGVTRFHPIFLGTRSSHGRLRGGAVRLPDLRPVRWSEHLARQPSVTYREAITHVQQCREAHLPLVPIAERPALSQFLPALRAIADHATYAGEDGRIWTSESAARERLDEELAALEAEIEGSRP